MRIRPVVVAGDIAFVPLRKGINPPLAMIDAEDAPIIGAYNWCLDSKGYVQRGYGPKGRVRNQHLHRVILGARDGTIVEHINGNPLDNRRGNLRFVTAITNSANNVAARSADAAPSGVIWNGLRKRFHVWVKSSEPGFSNNHFFLGEFYTKDEADRVYAQALRAPSILEGLP